MAQVKIVDHEVVVTKIVQMAELALTREEVGIIRTALFWHERTDTPDVKQLSNTFIKLYDEME